MDESGGGSKYGGGKAANRDGSFCSVELCGRFDASATRGVPRVGRNSVGARVVLVPKDGGFSSAMCSPIAACRVESSASLSDTYCSEGVRIWGVFG